MLHFMLIGFCLTAGGLVAFCFAQQIEWGLWTTGPDDLIASLKGLRDKVRKGLRDRVRKLFGGK